MRGAGKQSLAAGLLGPGVCRRETAVVPGRRPPTTEVPQNSLCYQVGFLRSPVWGYLLPP